MNVKKIVYGIAAVCSAAMILTGCSNALNADFAAADAENDSAARTAYSVSTESALKSAIKNAKAGDTIKLASNIKLTSQLQILNSGTSSSKINFNGNGKTLDCSGISSGWGIKVNGSYWNITNMTVTKAPDCGIVFQVGGNNYIAYVKTTYNGDSGIQVYNSAKNVYVYKCESYYNYDSDNGGEDADGFACKLSGGSGNKFEGCIAKYNSDDGWDLYGQPYGVSMISCTASYNGYRNSSLQTTANGDGNGFKLGSSGQNVKHTLSGCTATNNLGSGYDGNGNTATMSISNCSSSGNKKYQWYRITGIANK